MISYRNDQQQGFESELNMLQDAKKLADQYEHQDQRLMSEYRRLLSGYEKLLRVTKKILTISDRQGVALKRCEDEMKALLNNASQGFLTFGESGIVHKQYSQACYRICNQKPSGMHFAELLWEASGEESQAVKALLAMMFKEAEGHRKESLLAELPNLVILRDRHIQLEYKWIQQAEGERETQAVMVVMTDMTVQLKSQEKVEYLSYFDSLTGLRNRAYVETNLAEFFQNDQFPVSLVLLDMNGLKLANDVFGHQLGDRLLTDAAQLIRETFGDEAVAARWGGDEFIVLLPRTEEEACLSKIGELKQACQVKKPYPIQVSMAIGCVTSGHEDGEFLSMFQAAEKEMYKNKLIESKMVRRSLMSNINEAMYARDIEDAKHIDRVEKLAVGFAGRVGVEAQSAQMMNLKLLINLHDVGKVVIPSHILEKEGSLTEEEWDVMRSHSEIGYRMALSLGEPALAEAILSLHERWDGLGYPYGLKEDQIPMLSRLFAIVDSYDIMTHDQVYRKAMSKEQALQNIAEESGFQFDPSMAEAFLDYMRESLPVEEERQCQESRSAD
ncbi:bifunctional diguanylate cyclase/phosphohydrolase [Paenibacillus hexagrammi]|uniref:Diguanylate cyclase n=1 Tax=Paenibacillus hexagrammi TaxID=2908839 RepID=A0ABY3SMA9_9BACL|nr:diguanylate cyclase [Paenibacillus sp. YPD9-1]UJF34670.1 diguanylate cyclase [Paenibacillus sp. YPD9-1]